MIDETVNGGKKASEDKSKGSWKTVGGEIFQRCTARDGQMARFGISRFDSGADVGLKGEFC